MKLAIHGRPNYNDRQRVERILAALHTYKAITNLIIEDMPGLPRLVKDWADVNGVPFTAVESKLPWLSAARLGYRRNHMMIDHRPDMVLAFPGGEQTKHFVDLAKQSNIQVVYVDTLMP
jgi:hypothetical protein